MSARRLVIVRHGRAEAYAADDHERELTPRGAEDAQALGRWLAAQEWLPDHAVVSSATRTQQTWTALAEAAGVTLEPVVEDGVYNAGPEAVLDVLRAVPQEVVTLLLLGHNPTVAWLANSLDDGDGDPAELMAVMDGFPPASCALLEVEGGWADLADGSARLLRSWRP
ncbi:histidine phosphatase family protein [Nocardioidaceae bacterium]|nr:histidine phosphatase family protein [Nocardioidaceae bacterium]